MNTGVGLISFFFPCSLYIRGNETYTLRGKEYGARRCVMFLKRFIYTRLARLHALARICIRQHTVSQLGNAADWCKACVSVGAFAAAAQV